MQGQFFVDRQGHAGVRRARAAVLAGLLAAAMVFGVVPNVPGAEAAAQTAAVRGPVTLESPDDSGSGSADSSVGIDSNAESDADGVPEGEPEVAPGSGGAEGDAEAKQPPAAAPEDEPRGPDGGIASNSPGPDTAKPWPGEEAALSESVQAMSTGGRGTVLGDDYPAKYKNLPWPNVPAYIWDEWNFAYRQCTSFVSWRLNSANGVKFSNQYGGLYAWGDAGQWAASARSLGIRVDTSPEVGAIAWSGPLYAGASGFGHVAWVSRVLDNGYIVIEEYNAGWAGSYGTRTLRANEFQGYIHIKDMVAPFTKSPLPTISGAHSANSELTANATGWSPTPTKLTYRWLRDGAPISGATGKTYSPVLADVGKKLSVEVTGIRAGYTAPARRSVETARIMMPDLNGNGLDDTQEMLPWNSDVGGLEISDSGPS